MFRPEPGKKPPDHIWFFDAGSHSQSQDACCQKTEGCGCRLNASAGCRRFFSVFLIGFLCLAKLVLNGGLICKMASNKDLPSSGIFFKKRLFFCPVGFKLFLYLRQISLTGCKTVLIAGIGNFVFNGAYFAQKRCVSLCGLRYQLCSHFPPLGF